MRPILDAIVELHDGLDAAGIHHAFGGAFASSLVSASSASASSCVSSVGSGGGFGSSKMIAARTVLSGKPVLNGSLMGAR